MKRTIVTCFGMFAAICMLSQNAAPKEIVINLEEDPSEITSIADIIRMEEGENKDYSDVPCESKSEYKSYIKLGFNLARLVPDEEINLGSSYNYDLAPHFKADWGAGIQIGHNYTVHTQPVLGMLWFNVDAVFADLSLNHYSAEDGDYVYNSSQVWTGPGSDGNSVDYHFIPWCLEKYEANFGMSVGPSITVNPFKQNLKLQNLTFNVFYHIGYHASLMWMQNNLNLDGSYPAQGNFNPVNDNIKLTYGHGFMNSFGLDVNWRMFGIGIEKLYGYLSYKSMQKNIYGNGKYKFIDDQTKIYLSIKF